MKTLYVFTMDGCSHCVAQKKFLSRCPIPGWTIKYVDCDKQPALANKHKINATPTLITSTGKRHEGYAGREEILKLTKYG